MKIPLHSFMNTADELHAFTIGFFEVLCPWPPRYTLRAMPYPTEYHYYAFGRGMAVMAWIIIAKIIQEVFF